MSIYNPEQVLAPTSVSNVVLSTTATAATNIPEMGWHRFSAVGGDVYILFGDSAIAAPTTLTGWYIAAGSFQDFLCGGAPPTSASISAARMPGREYYRAIAAAGTPTLKITYVGG